MIKDYSLGDFRFFVDGNMVDIHVAGNWGNRVRIEQARNVYRAVRDGVLEHHKGKDAFQTIEEVQAFVDYEYLFEEYDNMQGNDGVPVIMIRKDATAYIKRYSWNEWQCGMMLCRDMGWSKKCSDGKIRNFDYV